MVVLPDFQGIGLGIILLNEIAKYIKATHKEHICNITTSNPALINGLKNKTDWICTAFGRAKMQTGKKLQAINNSNRGHIITATFKYVGTNN